MLFWHQLFFLLSHKNYHSLLPICFVLLLFVDKHFRKFIQSHPELPQSLRFHDLCGSHVTRSLDLGINPKTVSHDPFLFPSFLSHSHVTKMRNPHFCSPSLCLEMRVSRSPYPAKKLIILSIPWIALMSSVAGVSFVLWLHTSSWTVRQFIWCRSVQAVPYALSIRPSPPPTSMTAPRFSFLMGFSFRKRAAQ